MGDRAYLENLERARECELCGEDRGTHRPAIACAACGSPLAVDVRFAIRISGAGPACSAGCLEALQSGEPMDADVCPVCGVSWEEVRPAPRSCAVCARSLSFSDGYVGLSRGGHLQTFCGPECLEAYLRRANPYCG